MDVVLPLGEPLGGRYRLERELGRGGMATVYLAHDDMAGGDVALKLLLPELAARVGLARFTREIRIVSRLTHPGILPVLDSGEYRGVPYFTMPVVNGETLQQLLVRERQLSVPQAVQIACEVADALDNAHSAGFVHRDIKPSNILMDHGRALLADFGVARATDADEQETLTATGVTVGTASYMSPEQASADQLDGRSDIYSLACVLYEMLVGGPPFTGPTTQAIRARHAVDPVPSIRTVRPSVGPALAAVIERALAKTPADRFPTAGALRDALREAENSPATISSSVPVVPARRAPRAMVGAGIGAVVLAAGAFVALRGTASAATLDRNRVVGFPLEAPVAAGGTTGAGEDVATMIGSALDKRGALHWIDGWRLMPAESQRAGGQRLAPARARSIAEAQHAGYYLTGRVVLRGDSADVLLELVDVASDSVVMRPRASGLPSDLWRASLRAVNELLPRLVPGGEAKDLAAAWRDRDPGAVASFLAAEAAFRRAQPVRALELYREAVHADTLFALAALRGAQAASWDHRPSEASALVRAALGKPMPPQYEHYARGYAAYLAGSADSASAELERAVTIDPQFAAAWLQLGETYIHLVSSASDPDSVADVAFARARALDSSSVHGLLHPIEIRLRRHDAAGAQPMVERMLAASPDTFVASHVRFAIACVRDGAARTNWSAAVRIDPFAALTAGMALAGRGANPGCATNAFEAVTVFDTAKGRSIAGPERESALMGLLAVLMAQDRAAEIPGHVAKSMARGDGGASLLMLGATINPALDSVARAVALNDRRRFGDDYAKCSTAERCWILAVYSATHGRPAATAAIATVLAARATTDTGAATRLLAAATAAHATLARGDSTKARAQFAALVREPLPPGSTLSWDPGGALAAERLVYARLLLRHNEPAAARAVANAFDAPTPVSFVFYLRPALALRAEIADALGDTRGADRFRRRLASLAPSHVVATRSDAAPRHSTLSTE